MTTPRDAVAVGRLADQIAAAVVLCPSVAALAGGPVATYLPGRLVRGVAVRDGRVRVAVVARYGPSLAEVVEQVRAAAEPAAAGLQVDVLIEDIDLPGGWSQRP